jgi:hypothetical protein
MQFLENCRRSPNFWATFFHGKSYTIIATKTGWAAFWAKIFADSSGHPDTLRHLVEI